MSYMARCPRRRASSRWRTYTQARKPRARVPGVLPCHADKVPRGDCETKAVVVGLAQHAIMPHTGEQGDPALHFGDARRGATSAAMPRQKSRQPSGT